MDGEKKSRKQTLISILVNVDLWDGQQRTGRGTRRTHLVSFATTHERRLRALVVDVRPEILVQRVGRCFRLLDSLVDLYLGRFIQLLSNNIQIHHQRQHRNTSRP